MCGKWIRNAAVCYKIYVIEDLQILLASILKPSLRLSLEILKKKIFIFAGKRYVDVLNNGSSSQDSDQLLPSGLFPSIPNHQVCIVLSTFVTTKCPF